MKHQIVVQIFLKFWVTVKRKQILRFYHFRLRSVGRLVEIFKLRVYFLSQNSIEVLLEAHERDSLSFYEVGYTLQILKHTLVLVFRLEILIDEPLSYHLLYLLLIIVVKAKIFGP